MLGQNFARQSEWRVGSFGYLQGMIRNYNDSSLGHIETEFRRAEEFGPRIVDDLSLLFWKVGRRNLLRMIIKGSSVSMVAAIRLQQSLGRDRLKLKFDEGHVDLDGLTGVVYRWPKFGTLGISLFDKAWNLAVVFNFPARGNLDYLRHLAPVSMGHSDLCVQVDGRRVPLCWSELWPTETSSAGVSIAPAELNGRQLYLDLRSNFLQWRTQIMGAVIDYDRCVVRLSDLPRTKVCYAHLGAVRPAGQDFRLRAELSLEPAASVVRRADGIL